MKSVRTWTLLVTIACLVSLTPADANIKRNAGRRTTGGMGLDLKWYCQQQWGETSAAINVDRTADGWRCSRGSRLVGLSSEAACRAHYGNTAVSRVEASRAAGDLYCVLGLNLTAYCKSTYGEHARATKLVATDPHSWKCQRGGDYLDIGMRAACRHHYGAGAVPVLGRHDDPQAWTCEVN